MIKDKENLTIAKIFESTNLKEQRLLEIGCGDGRLTQGFHGKCLELVAVDPDADAIRTAKTNNPHIDFRVGSGESLDFPDGSFDVVLFTLSLHHQNSDKALEEAARVLKNGGQILVVEPAVDSEVSIVCNVFHDETPVLNKVIKSINESRFNIEFTETFCTQWEFVANQELYDWLFEFYQTPYDEIKIKEVNQILGHKQKTQPITLDDKLTITSMVNR